MASQPHDSGDVSFVELLDEEWILDGIARAIYRAHWRAPSPVWEAASSDVQDWVREQARAALAYLRALARRAAP
jgi:hypothetical protein